MKINALKKLIREVAAEVLAESSVDVAQAVEKLKSFAKTLGGKKPSGLIRREGSSNTWKLIADLSGRQSIAGPGSREHSVGGMGHRSGGF